MGNANPNPGVNEDAAVRLLLNLAAPPGSEQQTLVSWVRKLDGDADRFWLALAQVPGIRHDGRLWRLGDPGDHWTLTLVVLGHTVVATAPQGWAGGTNPGECQALFGEWMESWVQRLSFPSTPEPC